MKDRTIESKNLPTTSARNSATHRYKRAIFVID